jgi:hypothetical protein
MDRKEYQDTVNTAFPLRKGLEKDIIRRAYGKRKSRNFISSMAGVAALTVVILTAGIFLSDFEKSSQSRGNINVADNSNDGQGKIEQNLIQKMFTVKAYAAQTPQELMSGEQVSKVDLETGSAYYLSTENTNVYNKFYNLTEIADMTKYDELSEDGIRTVCYGFNLEVQGEDVESVTFTTDRGQFAKKIEYYNDILTDEERKTFFANYPECIGIGLKESSYSDLTPECVGDAENKTWAFVAVGDSYTVSVADQGNAENLYALTVSLPEESIPVEEDGKFGMFVQELIGSRIMISVTYDDGTTQSRELTITGSDGWNLQVSMD